MKNTSKRSIEIIERDKKVVSPSLTRSYDLVIDRAEGSTIYDVEGRAISILHQVLL